MGVYNIFVILSMNEDHKRLIHHISRVEGQLRALKTCLEEGTCKSDTVTLISSIDKSFDSLRARVIMNFLKYDLGLEETEKLKKLLTLVK